MKTSIKIILTGVCSGVVSSAATFFFTRKYYEEKIQKELGVITWEPKPQPQVEEPNYTAKAEAALKAYATVESDPLAEDLNVMEDLKANDVLPYTIDPKLFGEMPGYDLRYLNWYPSSKALTDEEDERMWPLDKDVDIMLGLENLNTFGEYDDNLVWIRDDIKKIDYEITKMDCEYEG